MTNAFVVRMKTWDEKTDGLVSRIKEGLVDNDVILGWSVVQGLVKIKERDAFKKQLATTYPDLAKNTRRLGSAAGNLWRFIWDITENDYVVVPDARQFYVAKVTGPARHEVRCVPTDTAHRRKVEWLNQGRPIPRIKASSGLQSRMKVYQTVAWADEFVDEIKELLRTGGSVRAVGEEINDRMCNALLTQLRNGRMNDRLFEKFVRALLERLGCSNVKLVPRIVDKGADVVGYHDALGISVVAQVKFHRDKRSPTGRDCIEELQKGMEAESANVGWAVTLGGFNEEAQRLAEKLSRDENLSIRLIDGDELVKLAIEYGIPLRFDEP